MLCLKAGPGGVENTSYSEETIRSRTFSTDPAGQLDVLGEDGDTLGMDCAEIGVLEKAHKVGLRCLLKSQDS